MDDHATNPHPRRSAGPQVSLANPSGFPLNAFGAIMADDHEVSTFDLRCIRSWLRYVPDRCARCRSADRRQHRSTRLERYMRCKDCSQVRGYAHKKEPN